MYSTPEFPDFALTSYGWRGFGGLLLSSKGKLTPQYNLEAAWKRQLAPTSGVDQILLFDTNIKSLYRHRLPGHYRLDVDENVLKNRCLICTTRSEDDAKFNISVVQEHSDRKVVETYDIEMHGTKESFPNWWLNCDENPTNKKQFQEQIVELRASVEKDLGRYFAKGRSNLYYVNQKNEAKAAFKGSVLCWEQNPLISEEIVLLSNDRMLWSGNIGENLGRTKLAEGEPLRDIAYTDHPRVITAAEKIFIRTLDLRCDNATTSNLLFQAPGFAEELYRSNYYITEEMLEIPTWTHIKSLPENPYNIVALSTNNVFLLDERMPGRAILQNHHCIPNGVQLLTTGEPISDPAGDGSIQCFYMLDQFCTGIWKMELYKHTNEDWSAIRPLHGVPDPNDKEYILRKRDMSAVQHVYPPTRGISVASFKSSWTGRSLELLFRYLDDGSVMYRMYLYGMSVDEQSDINLVSLDRNDIYSSEKHRRDHSKFVDMFGEMCMMPKESNCDLIDVEVELPRQRYSLRKDLDPKKKLYSSAIPLKPLHYVHPDAYYSNIVEKYWAGDYGAPSTSNKAKSQ